MVRHVFPEALEGSSAEKEFEISMVEFNRYPDPKENPRFYLVIFIISLVFESGANFYVIS